MSISGAFEEGRNLAHDVDYRWLPWRKHNLDHTNEGFLSTIAFWATTLFGIMAGWLLPGTGPAPKQKVACLLAAGASGIGLGLLLGNQFPAIKRSWTSSFCLVASGFASMMLRAFYLIVDAWRWQRWCKPFLWIGSKALAAYLAVTLVDFPSIAARFVGGDVEVFSNAHLANGIGGVLIAIAGLSFPVLLVRCPSRKKSFIRL